MLVCHAVDFRPRNECCLHLRAKRAKVTTPSPPDELNVDIGPDGKVYGIELLNAKSKVLWISSVAGKSDVREPTFWREIRDGHCRLKLNEKGPNHFAVIIAQDPVCASAASCGNRSRISLSVARIWFLRGIAALVGGAVEGGRWTMMARLILSGRFRSSFCLSVRAKMSPYPTLRHVEQ